MKRIVLASIAAIMCISLCAQTNAMFPKEGSVNVCKISISSPMGAQTMYSKESIETAGGFITYKVDAYKDLEDASPIQSSSIKYKIGDKGYTVSMKDAMKDQLAQIGDLEIIETSGDLELPAAMEVGNTYPDASMKLKGNIQGMDMDLTMSIKNRKIEVKESIETPAGKFDCYKFSQSIVTEVMGQEVVTLVDAWYADGIGCVKQVINSMGGMVANTTELIEIK